MQNHSLVDGAVSSKDVLPLSGVKMPSSSPVQFRINDFFSVAPKPPEAPKRGRPAKKSKSGRPRKADIDKGVRHASEQPKSGIQLPQDKDARNRYELFRTLPPHATWS